MKKPIIITSIIIFMLMCSIAGVIYFFFLPNNEVVAAFDEGKLNLVIEGELIQSKDQPKIVDEQILLPMSVVKEYFDPNIYWDDALKKVTITTKDRVVRMKTDSLNALVNNKPMLLKIPVTVENDVVFIPIEFLSDFYGIDITFLKLNNVIVADFKNSIKHITEPISMDAVIRRGHTIHYPIVKKFDSDTDKTEDKVLRVFEEYDKWYKVRAADGSIGFIEKRFVALKKVIADNDPVEEIETVVWKPVKGKVNLVWEMMYGKTPELSKIGKMEGLDVVSPTWFQVANEKGELINRADPKYVEWAHKNGYKVWALLSNDFGSAAMTGKVLNNTDVRENIIRQVLAFAALYKLDGINIDFENVNKKDRDALTQFVREITPLLKEQGLIVSIDVTVPDGSDNWSLCYDRKALGQVVDYVMLMAYDQHWATSPIAGSVAELSWVEKNIGKMLKLVPKEKLILGMPFYTRVWKEETDDNGKVKVSSPQALSMESAKKMVKENNAQVRWDDASGQFYTEFKKEGSLFKIWLEDENSIDLRSALVQKYNLAGAAAWKRNNEVPEIWNILNKNLKVITSYQEWISNKTERKYALK